MSLHIGVVRIGLGQQPALDVLYDTSDSDRHLPPFCHVAYDPDIARVIEHLPASERVRFGTAVRAY